MKITLEKILEFHDLFPEAKSLDIRSILKKYSKEHLVRSSHVLSNNYGKAYIPDNNNTFFSKVSEKYMNILNARFEALFGSNNYSRVCYCTPKTALELMRFVFDIPINEYQNNGNDEDFEYDLFRVILQINENLTSFKHCQKLDLATLSFFSFYVMNDIVIRDITDTFIKQVQYYSLLSDFIEQNEDCKKAKDLFFEKAGITNMNQYSKTWLALFYLSYKYQEQKLKECPILDLTELKDTDKTLTHSVLDFLSIDINSHIAYDSKEDKSRDNNVDYRFFRARPLIKIAPQKYIIYNLHILTERLYNSLFFDLKDGFDDPFNFYNTNFVERILFQSQIVKCINFKRKYTIFPSYDNIHKSIKMKEKANQPDFYIREGDCLIIFECKAIRLNGELKDNADIDTLLSTMKNKLFLSKENIDKSRKEKKEERVGVTQLVHHMENIYKDEFEWDKEIPENVAYYPVLILEDSRLTAPGISYIINSWYKPLIRQKLPGQMCLPIVVMSLNTLLTYSYAFKIRGFHSIFDEYFKKTTKFLNNGTTWEFNQMGDFDTYIQENYKIRKSEKNKMFKDAIKSLVGRG